MSIDTVVLGASGYVGGELLRLINAHPEFQLTAAVSTSRNGQSIGSVFPHLANDYADKLFLGPDTWVDRIESGANLALFSAAPHGTSASIVSAALESTAQRNLNVHVVDSSADFRYASAAQFESVYGIKHQAPELLNKFFCGVPEQVAGIGATHAGHPGCFATAVLLAAVPLVQSGLATSEMFVTAITGSTGSGRSPQAGTHHPERHNNLYAYKPLSHRHVPEIESLITKACGREATVNFVPHSGPFARGIYVTLQARLVTETPAGEIAEMFQNYYGNSPFVHFVDDVPRLKDIVVSNYCHLGATVRKNTVVVMCAIDNLVKGSAGGAVQWMNRLWSLPESSGLLSAPPAWT